MQRAQLAILDMGDSLPIYNGHLGRKREREREKERERVKVSLLFAIFRTRFVCHCYNTLYKQINIVNNNNNNNKGIIKA